MKLDFPKLDDGDPSLWVSRAKQFFKYYLTLDDSNAVIISNSSKRKSYWHDWLVAHHRKSTCDEFVD
jgi:hypothetical protein